VGTHAHTKVLSGMLQEGRVFQESWEQANCVEVLLETLLGSCVENNKTLLYLLKIGHCSIVHLVGCGGGACVGMLCLTARCVYYSTQAVCLAVSSCCWWQNVSYF